MPDSSTVRWLRNSPQGQTPMPAKYDRQKSRQTNIRLSPLGNRLLDTIVKHHGVNKTAAVEMALRYYGRDLGLLASAGPVTVLEPVDTDVGPADPSAEPTHAG